MADKKLKYDGAWEDHQVVGNRDESQGKVKVHFGEVVWKPHEYIIAKRLLKVGIDHPQNIWFFAEKFWNIFITFAKAPMSRRFLLVLAVHFDLRQDQIENNRVYQEH